MQECVTFQAECLFRVEGYVHSEYGKYELPQLIPLQNNILEFIKDSLQWGKKCAEIRASLTKDVLRSERVASIINDPEKIKEEIMKAIGVQNQLSIMVSMEEF